MWTETTTQMLSRFLFLSCAFLSGCLLLSACPLFKGDSTREKELLGNYKTYCPQKVREYGERYPGLAKRLEARLAKAKKAFVEAKKIKRLADRVAAMKKALAPISLPLEHLRSFEMYNEQVEQNCCKKPAHKTVLAEMKAARRALAKATPSDAQLNAMLAAAARAADRRYTTLENETAPSK
jgi:uncharacterized protein YhaN